MGLSPKQARDAALPHPSALSSRAQSRDPYTLTRAQRRQGVLPHFRGRRRWTLILQCASTDPAIPWKSGASAPRKAPSIIVCHSDRSRSERDGGAEEPAFLASTTIHVGTAASAVHRSAATLMWNGHSVAFDLDFDLAGHKHVPLQDRGRTPLRPRVKPPPPSFCHSDRSRSERDGGAEELAFLRGQAQPGRAREL